MSQSFQVKPKETAVRGNLKVAPKEVSVKGDLRVKPKHVSGGDFQVKPKAVKQSDPTAKASSTVTQGGEEVSAFGSNPMQKLKTKKSGSPIKQRDPSGGGGGTALDPGKPRTTSSTYKGGTPDIYYSGGAPNKTSGGGGGRGPGVGAQSNLEDDWAARNAVGSYNQQKSATTGGSILNKTDLDPFTGFASRYAPGMTYQLYNDPSIFGRDTLSQMGMGPNKQMAAAYAPAANDALTIAMLLNNAGSGQGLEGQNLNTANEILRNMATAGGGVVDPHQLINQLMNPTGNLAAYLGINNGATAEQVMQGLKPLLQSSVFGMDPLAQRAMMNSLEGNLTNFNTQLAHGQPMAGNSYIDYLRKHSILGSM